MRLSRFCQEFARGLQAYPRRPRIRLLSAQVSSAGDHGSEGGPEVVADRSPLESDPAVDGPALRAAYVDRQVRIAKLRDQVGNGASVDPSTVKVSADEYSRYLEKAYKAADFKKPRNMIGLTKTLPDEEMKQALAENAPVDDAALRGLAQSRAAAVQEYFEGKIDSKRIFVVAPKMNADGVTDKGAPTRVDFGLKS